MKKLSLESNPIFTFIIYEFILMFIAFGVCIFLPYKFTELFFGYLFGVAGIIIGFILMVKHTDEVLELYDMGKGKRKALYNYLFRMMIYLMFSYIAVYLLKLNVFTFFIGLLTIKLIIYLDFWFSSRR